MALFKKKQQAMPVVIQVESPSYTLQSIEHRIKMVLSAEKKLQERIARFETSMTDLGENTFDRVQETRNELIDIAKEYKELQERFTVIVKALGLIAKQEELERTKRAVEQYDPADFITRNEFDKLV